MPVSTTPPSYTPKWYDSTFLVVLLILFLFPVGVYALIKNRRLSTGGKVMVGGAVMFLIFSLGAAVVLASYYIISRSPEYQTALQSWKDKVSPQSPKEVKAVVTDTDTTLHSTQETRAETVPLPPVTVESRSTPRTPPPIVKPSEPIPPVPVEYTPPVISAAEEAARALAAQQQAAAQQKANAERNARELDLFVAEINSDAKLFNIMKQRQAAEYEQAVNEFSWTNDPVEQAKMLVENFKQTSGRAKETSFDAKTLSAYFNAAFLQDHNLKLSQRREEIRQNVASLENTDGRVRQFQDRLAQKIDDANQRLTAANKTQIPQALVEPALERHLTDVKNHFAALPSRPTLLSDILQNTPLTAPKAEPPLAYVPPRNIPPVPTQPDVPLTPVEPVSPFSPRPPATPPYAPATPDIPAAPASPVVPAAPSAPAGAPGNSEITGGWIRGDGKVSWVFDEGGAMSARMAGSRRPGTWSFDEKTATLSVQLNNFQYRFTVTKGAKDQLTMEGGAGGASSMRFNKVSKF